MNVPKTSLYQEIHTAELFYFTEGSEAKLHEEIDLSRGCEYNINEKVAKQRLARLCEGGVIDGYVEYLYEYCYQ